MKARAFCFLFLAILLAQSIASVEAAESVVLEFFYHPDCAPCKAPKRLVEELRRDYSPHLIVVWRNMMFMEANERFIRYELSRRPAVVFNYDPSTALYNLTEDNLRARIEYYLAASEGWKGGEASEWNTSEVRPDLTLPLVIVSGLIDGINPCAFSLLIFFLSFLFSIRRRRLNVFLMGLMYIAGVFAGYISLGLGLLHTVSILDLEHPFGLFGIVLLFIMGLLQLREAVTFGKPLLRFPKFAVPIFKRLTERATLPVALALGYIVSLCEFPCSGGVYVGILVLLSSEVHRYGGILYLMVYNIMFVVPLILVLLLASNADILLRMDEWRVVSRRRLKLVSGVFLIALAILTWYWIYVEPLI